MDFLLGTLAFVQASALPGLLAVYVFRLGCVAPAIPTIFGISLIFNYVAVVGLVIVGEYTRSSFIAIILAELFSLAYLMRARGDWALRLLDWPIWVQTIENGRLLRNRFSLAPLTLIAELTAILISVVVIVGEFAAAVSHAGDGFDSWDAIQSWNRWAVEWASGNFPQSTYHYPQLLPTNWSISYVLTANTALTLFSSSLDRFFIPMLLFVLAWYGLRERRPMLVLAVPFCDLLFKNWLYGVLGASYADVPVAFFSISSALVLLARPRPAAGARERTLQITLSAILAFGAVSTKQAGAQWLLTLPVIVFVRSIKKQDFGVSIWHSAMIVIALMLCASAWYVYVQHQIDIGSMRSEVSYVTHDIYKGVGPIERVARATARLGFLLWFALVGTIFAIFVRRYRLLALFAAIPYFLVWATFFSYDNRNAAVAIPFLSLTAVVGWLAALELTWRHLCARRADMGRRAAHVTALGNALPHKIAAMPLGIAIWLLLVLSTPLLVFAVRHYSLPRLMERQSYYEVENLFGSNAAPYGHTLVAILMNTKGPAHVWSADRYTCLLTIVRIHGSCTSLETEDQFHAVLRKLQPNEENDIFIFVAPTAFRPALQSLANARSVTYVQSGNDFDLWSNRTAP